MGLGVASIAHRDMRPGKGAAVVDRVRRVDLNEKLHESVAVRMGDTLLEALERYARHVEAKAGVRLPRASIIRQLLAAELESRLEVLDLLLEEKP